MEATKPIRHLLPSSHANSEGQMRLKVGKIVDRSINYEDLVALVTSKEIVVDDKMLQPRPTDPKTKAAIVARFIIREQMQPTFAFEMIFATLSQLHGAATHLFATAAGLDPRAEATQLRVFLMIGQVLVLRIAETAVLRRLRREAYDEALLATAGEQLRQNVRAIVLAARESRP